MPRARTTSLSPFIRKNLGLINEKPDSKKKRKILTRKERRKLERKKVNIKEVKVNQKLRPQIIKGDECFTVDLNAIEPEEDATGRKKRSHEVTDSKLRKKIKIKDDVLDPEDMEIARLEKLLGVKNDKKKAADKLNKEYELFEGISGNFGDFLLELDELTESITNSKAGRNVQNLNETVASTVEYNTEDYDGNGVYINDDGGDEMKEDNDEDDNEEMDEVSVDSSEDEHKGIQQAPVGSDSHTYRPSAGEDIYGRIQDAEVAGKYIPPNRRSITITTVVDEQSEAVKVLRRLMNGQMNRLSDQTKDTVIRNMKDIFDKNSTTISTILLKDCILAACGNETQIMMSLIPIYASIVAALHFSVGIDVGALVVENIVLALSNTITERRSSKGLSENTLKSTEGHSLISSKLALNTLLLLVYLYNLRVLHHTLIMDILNDITGTSTGSSASDTQTGLVVIGEMEAELVTAVVEHCGPQLRADDSIGLKAIVATVNKVDVTESANMQPRLRFMLEAITDLKNNKSRRTQNSNADVVKGLRKWLGTLKMAIGCKSGDLCLRVSLRDLLNADERGRWWRAGASWKGRPEERTRTEDTLLPVLGKGDNNEISKSDGMSGIISTASQSEEQQLLKLAAKLRMNTNVRRSVFLVVMSSRDVGDAFERLQRLGYRGKQDRDVVRVLMECCGHEATYNVFYAQLMSLLCQHQRQFKISVQFAYWDVFKTFLDAEEDDGLLAGKRRDKKIANLARLLVHLVCRFHLGLAVLKPIDVTDLSEKGVLFLASFFMALFSFKMKDEEFTNVLDRVSTTADFATIRDSILLFLKRYLSTIPDGLSEDDTRLMRKRRKETLKTMEAMEMLDMIRAEEEPEPDDD